MTARVFNTRIDLAAETRQKMIALVNQKLADAFDLYSQTKQGQKHIFCLN